MRRSIFGPHIPSDLYIYVEKFHLYQKHRKQPTHQPLLQFSTKVGPMIFVAIDILRPRPKRKTSNKYIDMMTNKYKKLTWTISTIERQRRTCNLSLLKLWVVLYGIANRLLTDTSTQSVGTFSKAVCTGLNTRHMRTTLYHQHTYRQTE